MYHACEMKMMMKKAKPLQAHPHLELLGQRALQLQQLAQVRCEHHQLARGVALLQQIPHSGHTHIHLIGVHLQGPREQDIYASA